MALTSLSRRFVCLGKIGLFYEPDSVIISPASSKNPKNVNKSTRSDITKVSAVMSALLWSCVLLCIFRKVCSDKQGLIVGGDLGSILMDPHAAHMKMRCHEREGKKSMWMCGSSILNQRLLITAGHCLVSCETTTHIVISVGDENKESGILRTSNGIIVHSGYKPDTYDCDLALVKMSRPVKFTLKIKRVAIMKNPPYREMAHVSGWGVINEYKDIPVDLKTLSQKVWKNIDCRNKFADIPRGTICASSPNGNKEYAAEGDSGSGLLVREYILIGLVSYKSPNIDKSVIMYTDVGYYYDWITYTAHRLYCFSDTLDMKSRVRFF